MRWEPTPYVRPLLEAFDDHERYGVVVVDKEHARIFTVFLGEIEEEREALAAAEVRHKDASGTDHWRSQMHFQRQDDMHVRWHLAQVAALLDDVARMHAFDRLVLAGPIEATSELGRLLSRPLADRVVATVRLPVDTPADEILARTVAVAAEAERATERTRVAQVLDRGARAIEATLEALQEGRLGLLVYAEGFESRGAECPRCRALFAATSDSICGYCGERLLALDDVVGRALARVASSGAMWEKVHGDAAVRLTGAGGIGAVLRF